MSDQTIQSIALSLVAPGKGILAADESTGTISKRLASINTDPAEENRRGYRQLLLTTSGIEQYISGVIMFDETIRQETKEGIPFVKVLVDKGIVPGIKVDQGLENLSEGGVEKKTNGLDGLPERLKEYYDLGARFAKWRAVYTITPDLPSEECIKKNAEDLAVYAKHCQDAGLVPIVEPEVLMEGDHNIEKCYEVTKKVLVAVFDELKDKDVAIDGILLKPNMILSGQDGVEKDSAEKVAEMTVRCFREVLPVDLPGIVFLSGGQTEQQACENLNAMNMTDEVHPWELSFSYGRALQTSALKAWSGKQENVEKAQQALSHRAKLVSASRAGEYGSEMETEQ